MRQVVELIRLAAGYLTQRGSPSARLDAELLLAHALGMSRLDLYVQFDRPVTSAETDRFRELIRRRGQGEPVAYLLGEREFRGRLFTVNPAVLIPRPETELLVEAVLSLWRDEGYRGGWVVDVGTGSGAIAVSLALEHPGCRVAAVDVSADALEVARANGARHGVADAIVFLHGDLLQPLEARGLAPLEVIVSNPPYVAEEEWAHLDKTVRDYEPRLALDGGPDGLAVVRRLISESRRLLPEGGVLAMEVGAGQRAAVDEALAGAGFASRTWHDDWAGHPRVVVARRGGEPRMGRAGGAPRD